VAVGVLACGCGHGTTQRQGVAAYLVKVEGIQSSLATPLAQITKVASQFAKQRNGGTGAGILPQLPDEGSLLRSADQIDALRSKLAAISAPSPAQRLRSLTLSLVTQEGSLTRELAKMVIFLPAFEQVLRPLGPATTALQHALGVTQAQGYGASGVAAELSVKAAALRRYAEQLGSVLGRLQRLDPPAVTHPQYSAQLTTLQRMRTSAGQLAGALEQGSSNVRSLLLNFNQAAAGAQSLSAQRAQIAAVRAYDARVRSLTSDVQQIQLERARLQRTLG
jgi:hypothetical protein